MASKEFKYKIHHQNLSCGCPDTSELTPLDMTVYRFVFQDLEAENNHLPPLLINPHRVDLNTCELRCKGYALSFFSDYKKAEKRLIKFLERKPHLAEVFGNCIGKLDIKPDDGEGDKEDKFSHFNFHEYANDYEKRYDIEVVKIIPIG